VGISGDTLVVRPREGPQTKHPIRGVETVLLHGFAQVTTQALRKCVEHGVGVHWLTVTGHHLASLVATAGQVVCSILLPAACREYPRKEESRGGLSVW
jgi:CRISPR-associated protein Cas1